MPESWTSNRRRKERAIFAAIFFRIAHEITTDPTGGVASGVDPKWRAGVLGAFEHTVREAIDDDGRLFRQTENICSDVLRPYTDREITDVLVGAVHALQILVEHDVLRVVAGSPFDIGYTAFVAACQEQERNAARLEMRDDAGRALGWELLGRLQQRGLFPHVRLIDAEAA